MVGRLHEGVQHLRQRHLIGQPAEESKEDNKDKDGFEATLGGELQRSFQLLFDLFEDFFHPLVIECGGSFDGVVFCLSHSV